MKNKKDEYLNKVFFNNKGEELKVIAYRGARDIDVEFSDKTVITTEIGVVKKGQVKNPNAPLICGVGFVGEGVYEPTTMGIMNKNYSLWSNMIKRCYDTEVQERQPCYIGCTVTREWHNFQNFAKWYEENWKEYMDSEWHLDKDMICKDCKIYSPETCAFIPREINNFSKINLKVSKHLKGVIKSGRSLLFTCKIVKMGVTYTESFKTEIEAHEKYKKEKEAYALELAIKWKDLIDERVYKNLVNYKLER